MWNVPVLFSYIRPLRYFLLEGFQPVTSPSLPRLATHSNNSIFIRVEVNTIVLRLRLLLLLLPNVICCTCKPKYRTDKFINNSFVILYTSIHNKCSITAVDSKAVT